MSMNFVIPTLVVLSLLIGCGNQEDGSHKQTEGALPPLPPVNAENCKKENLNKLPSEELREKFSSMCLRISTYKPSPERKW